MKELSTLIEFRLTFCKSINEKIFPQISVKFPRLQNSPLVLRNPGSKAIENFTNTRGETGVGNWLEIILE